MRLPAGWVATTTGEVAETKLGKMLSAKSKVGANPRPYLRNKNVQWGRIVVDDLLRMDFSDDEFEVFRVRPDDLLVCEGGEVGRAAIWRDPTREIAFQKALHRVRPRSDVQPEFLLYLLMWLGQSNAFERFVTGSTIKHLPQEDLRRLPVPLPPLAEQRRIVAAIEEQFSRLEAASGEIASCRTRLNALKERLIRDAVTPRAVWESLKFEQGFSSVSGNGRKVKRRDYLEHGRFPVVDQGEEPVGGYTNDESVLYRGALPVLLFGDHTRRFKLLSEPFAVGADGVKLIAPRAGWDVRFAQLALSAADLPDRGYSRHFQFLRKIVIARPPLEEQRRIVAELEQQLSLIDALHASVSNAQRRSAALRAAILERAFRGELVSQDPADEPASVLLERIRADRAAAPPRSTRRRATMETS